MGWDYARYIATCKQCGHQGVCIRGDDDWMRTSTSWEGFSQIEPDPTAVGRKRASPQDMRPVCKCGSYNITVGEQIKD